MGARIGMLSTYPPTQCGIATFSAALVAHLVAAGADVGLVRLVDTPAPPVPLVVDQWVATEPDWRRRGLARAVMSELLAWYAQRNVTSIELHATVEAEPLYRSLGFSEGAGGRALRRQPTR